MQSIINSDFKVGILGGGQLGKMLCLAAQNWHLKTWILDGQKDFPAGEVCSHFIEGSFKNYDDVYAFGKQVDVLSIEIEHVNTEALLALEKEGIKVHPRPAALNIIKDKGLQKQFYVEHQLPTSEFQLYASGEAVKNAVQSGELKYPFVQKSRTAGYDGKGVAVIKTEQDFDKILMAPSLIEPLVPIEKELAVIVARNENGEIEAFPSVEMEFNPIANLVEYLVCPAAISDEISSMTIDIAKRIIEAFDICGLLAVEFFLTKSGEILINEVAPRPHNSGHHTIDSCYTSQFQQHLRAILNLPLGSTKMKSPSVMVNLLGEEGHTGTAHYDGFANSMAVEGCKMHLYGKAVTKPFRKMGHATILAENVETARNRAKEVKNRLKIIS